MVSSDLKLKTSLLGLCAFLHDIGKPYQRTGVRVSEKYSKTSTDRQLILNEDSHLHALHTANFFDNFLGDNSLIVKLWNETFKDRSMQITSAGHHNPDNDPLKNLISLADQIASGLDRINYEERQKKSVFDYRKVRMVPLLETVSLFGKPSFNFRYPLEQVNIKSIFPEDLMTRDNTNIGERGNTAEESYKAIVKHFESGFKKLDQRSIKNFIDGLISISEESFSFVPASTMGEFDDVSLYDHSKTTAAIATSLFKYWDGGKLPESSENAFVIIRGEFFGIQKFIFSEGSESAKNPAKILRGRSFYVSLMTEIASEMLLTELNLPSFNVMLNAAGMFVILADNTEASKEAIKNVNKKINDWLFDKFFGEVYFGIAYTEASPEDFSEKHFETLWLNILTEMEKVKFSKFLMLKIKGVFDNYHKKFDKQKACSICGRESAVNGEVGDICQELIILGEKLVDDDLRYIIISQERNGNVFGTYNYEFRDSVDDEKIFGKNSKVIDISLFKGFEGFYKAKINTHVARSGKRVKTFEEIASSGEKGLDAIGVFKADVDNLGAIFAVGLEEPHNKGENKRLTFSRLSQLSRMINNFFAYYLPYKLKNDPRFVDTYTVFAGGDDLFLIGRYDSIFELSLELSEDFNSYVAKNKEVTISGGVSIFKPNTPIAYMAEVVEKNLDLSKKYTDKMTNIKGNLTFLGATDKWESFKRFYEDFKKDLHLFPKTTSFYYKLLEILGMKMRLSDPEYSYELMKNIMWLPRLKYLLARHIKKNDLEKASEILLRNIENNPSVFRALLMLELYKNRKKRG